MEAELQELIRQKLELISGAPGRGGGVGLFKLFPMAQLNGLVEPLKPN